MEFTISILFIRVIAIILNIAGVVMAAVFGPPYLIMSAEKRAYLAGVEPTNPYIRKAATRDMLSIIGIGLFLAGAVLHLVANSVSVPLYFDLSFKPNF